MVLQDYEPKNCGSQPRPGKATSSFPQQNDQILVFYSVFRKEGFATLQHNNFSKGRERIIPTFIYYSQGCRQQGLKAPVQLFHLSQTSAYLAVAQKEIFLESERLRFKSWIQTLINRMSLGKSFIFSEFGFLFVCRISEHLSSQD